MPIVETTYRLDHPPAVVFAQFARADHILETAPEDWNLQLEGPVPAFVEGSRLVVRGRRWGVSQRLVSEITALVPPVRLVLEQREGPLRRLIHSCFFETVEGGTQVREVIDFAPPGGLLGFMVTESMLRTELESVFLHRRTRVRELLAARSSQE